MHSNVVAFAIHAGATAKASRGAQHPMTRQGRSKQKWRFVSIYLTARDKSESKWRSRPLEYPQIVLVSATTAEQFRRSKSAPAVLQFIPKGDDRLTVWTVDSPRDH
jgi:hypothetical protein